MKLRTLAFSIFLSSLLMADTQSSALFDMSLEELMNIEIEGSTKTKHSILEVPSSVTVFTQKEIQNMGISNLDDLKNFVPGFQSRRSRNDSVSSKVTSRGRTSGEAGRDVLVLIDGQRINIDLNGGTGLSSSRIALENVKKVEFIRGAGSALYGSNAFAAVINITTIKDQNQITIRGAKDSVKATALVSIKDEELKFSGFVKSIKDNGETYNNPYNSIPNNTTKTKDPYDSLDVYLQTFYKDFSFYISHTSRKMDEFYIVGKLSNDNDREFETSYIRGTYDFNYKNFNSQIALSFIESIDKINSVDLNTVVNGSTDVKEQTPSIEYFGDYEINNNNSIQFGAEYRKPKIVDATVRYNVPLYPNPLEPDYTYPLLDESSRDIYGLYVQYQGDVNDIYFNFGLRYDDYSDFGSTVNPRAALVYKVSDTGSIKFLYSSAYRAPSRQELSLQNNGVIVGNEDLDAEKIDTYEVVLSYKTINQMLNISFYRNDIEDLIGSNGVTYENEGSPTYNGVELEYSGIFFENLQTRFTFSHLIDTADVNDKISEDLASAIVNYNYSKFNFNINAYYHSHTYSSFTTDNEKVPSYIITNTKITYAYTKNLNLYIQANNLFDKEYYSPTGNLNSSVNMPGRGFEGFVGLEYSF